jgi:hypothetical protein
MEQQIFMQGSLKAAFDIANIIYIFTKRPALERRSTVPSLPLRLVFPDICNETISLMMAV